MTTLSKPYESREGSEFQTYNGFSIEYRDASHRYHGHINNERQPWVSVTSALAIVDKPALRKWFGNQDATAVLDLERKGELVGIPTDQAIHVTRQRGLGAEAQRDAGAQRGTALHQALQVYCEKATVPRLSDFEPHVRGYVQGLCSWLLEASPEPLIVERIVGSPKEQFAGRFDLLCEIDGRRVLVDLKSAAKPYPEHHLQLAGYRYAMQECGLNGVEEALILAVSESGHFITAPCRAEG